MKKDIEKYVNDSINAEVPPSLAKEVIVNKLSEPNEEKQRQKRRSKQYIIKFASAAAALVLVLSGALLAGNFLNQKESTAPGATPEIFAAEDYKDVYAKFKEIKKNNSSNTVFNGYYGIGAVPEAGANFVTDEAAAVKSENTAAFGKTNVQENGIDEGDIIKTDGKNIFLADQNNGAVYIVKADGGKTEKLSEIKISGDVNIQEIYISGNTLAVIYTEINHSKQTYPQDDSACICGGFPAMWHYTETKLNVYDIGDPEKAGLISNSSQSGEFISSRLKDGKLYLISSYCVDVSAEDYEKTCIPEISENGVNRRIPAEKISIIKDTNSPTFAVISTFDITSAKKTDDSAIFGDPSNVYMSENALYLIENKSDEKYYTPYLNIVKFGFTETGVEYIASASADGRINDTLSMSEQGGYLRVATTGCVVSDPKKKAIMTHSEYQTNKLYVFDSKLNRVGLIGGFAKSEMIKSARYIGNYAYIVTFRQTDPLFVINLSDPKNPVIEGELKIPGFSNYLHPIEDGYLIGVGYDGDRSGFNQNMKVSLFSVADPKNPKEVSLLKVADEKGYVDSSLSDSYKAFVSLQNGEFAVPFRYCAFSGDVKENAFVRYKVHGEKLTEIARYGIGIDGMIIGGTYIGNYFYVFSSHSDGAKITSFDLTSNSKLSVTALSAE